MGLFSKLFGTNNHRNPMDDKPPLYGGDGSSNAQAAVVNCASMSMANHLIDGYITEQHGTKDIDWKRGVEMFDNSPNIPEFTVRIVDIECSDGSHVNYYFDVSRPMAATKKAAKMLGDWPKDVD